MRYRTLLFDLDHTLLDSDESEVLLLISYQLFARYSPLGTLLNGKRTRPGPEPAIAEPAPTRTTTV